LQEQELRLLLLARFLDRMVWQVLSKVPVKGSCRGFFPIRFVQRCGFRQRQVSCRLVVSGRRLGWDSVRQDGRQLVLRIWRREQRQKLFVAAQLPVAAAEVEVELDKDKMQVRTLRINFSPHQSSESGSSITWVFWMTILTRRG
jgi:hypothetical protein